MSTHLPLRAIEVTRTYGGRPVVDRASLTLAPGKTTALLGASGAGKSTLLRLMAGLEPVDGGEIRLGDDVLSSRSLHRPAEERHIGLIFQDFALFPHLNALENVGFGLTRFPREERRRKSAAWLDQLGLTHRAKAYPHQLSGGEQQRVSIARALAADPVAILMDEPFSGLDVTLKSEVREIALKAVAEAGMPALLVSHDASEAMRDADRIAVMKDGVVLQEGLPEDLYLHPASPAAARALGPLSLVSRAALPEAWQAQLPAHAHYHIRPEAIYLDPESGTKLNVVSAKRTSTLIEITVEFETGEQVLVAGIGPHLPKPGQTAPFSLAPDFVFSFGSDKA